LKLVELIVGARGWFWLGCGYDIGWGWYVDVVDGIVVMGSLWLRLEGCLGSILTVDLYLSSNCSFLADSPSTDTVAVTTRSNSELA